MEGRKLARLAAGPKFVCGLIQQMKDNVQELKVLDALMEDVGSVLAGLRQDMLTQQSAWLSKEKLAGLKRAMDNIQASADATVKLVTWHKGLNKLLRAYHADDFKNRCLDIRRELMTGLSVLNTHTGISNMYLMQTLQEAIKSVGSAQFDITQEMKEVQQVLQEVYRQGQSMPAKVAAEVVKLLGHAPTATDLEELRLEHAKATEAKEMLHLEQLIQALELSVSYARQQQAPPRSFICPIFKDIMKDPVILVDSGYTFERNAIEQSLKFKHECPITRKPVTNCDPLQPNYALRDAIQEWQRSRYDTEPDSAAPAAPAAKGSSSPTAPAVPAALGSSSPTAPAAPASLAAPSAVGSSLSASAASGSAAPPPAASSSTSAPRSHSSTGLQASTSTSPVVVPHTAGIRALSAMGVLEGTVKKTWYKPSTWWPPAVALETIQATPMPHSATNPGSSNVATNPGTANMATNPETSIVDTNSGTSTSQTLHASGGSQIWASPASSARLARLSADEEEAAYRRGVLNRLKIDWNALEIGRELGRGGFGTVAKGMWQGKAVAVKTLNLERLGSHAQDELRRELLAMCEVRHPCIAHAYGLVDDGTHCALVMRYYRNGTVAQAIAEQEYVDLGMVSRLAMAQQVASGMCCLHDHGLLHGDLKTSNLLIEDDRLGVAISDFGLASRAGQSLAGGALTVSISPPEVLLDPTAPRTQAGDVYAFGIVLLEITSGRLVYSGMRADQVRIVICSGKRAMIPKCVPQMIAVIISDCWAQEAEDRPSSPEVLRRLLEVELEEEQEREEHEWDDIDGVGAYMRRRRRS